MAGHQQQTSHVAFWIGLTLTLALFQLTSAQNYHFSTNWGAGGKKRSMESSEATALESTCVFRPDVVDIINKIIQDEVSRIQTTCSIGLSRRLRELLEMQGAAGKLDNDKW